MGRSQVSIFRRKKKKLEFEIVSKDIPLSHLTRWFLYDSGLIEPNELVSRLGLNPVSDEGNAKEEEDSDIRLANIDSLLPFLNIISDITADVITNLQVKDIEESGDEDARQAVHEMTIMRHMYKVVALSALVSGFASAKELGLISSDAVENMRIEDGNLDEQ